MYQCSGKEPCDRCVKTGAICTIDEEGDQRRKDGLKRKLDSYQEKASLLDRLVATLQETSKTRAAQILNLIRSNASLEEVQLFLDDFIERSKVEKTPELVEICSGVRDLNESQKRAALARLHPKRLSDIVLFQVPAAPWTSVTKDNEFVSHLISMWFSWTHPFLNWIDRDLFIRDMQSGNLDSEFCSPFLVNIILADACPFSDYPEAYAVAGQAWSRGLQFYKEAKQHLDQSNGKVTVPYVQGLGVLYACTCMMGKDRTGWIYLGQLAYAIHELARKHKPPPPDADPDTQHKSRAIDMAIWGLFNLASMTGLAYQKGGLIKMPHREYSPAHDDLHGEEWTDYPHRSDTVESHTQCLFLTFSEFSVIEYDLSWSLFGKGEQKLNFELVKATENMHTRMLEFYERMPKCLKTTKVPPHVLAFRLKYHTTIQIVFGYLRDLPTAEEENGGQCPEWATSTRQKSRQICIESALESGKLIDMHRDWWGFELMPPANVHWITVSMFTLLGDMEEEGSRAAFVSLSVAAKAFANRWPLGKAMLRLVQVTAKQMQVSLPVETEALFTDFEKRLWTSEDRKLLSSQYPNFAHSMKRGEVDEVEMDAFLEKFDECYLDDEDEVSPLESPDGSVEVGSDKVRGEEAERAEKEGEQDGHRRQVQSS
ncbi:hypothetical protein N7454_004466 [Penicillium verhagenii]|nr:hypothetical protein N7454_004466 [Penicillium verhagenii]